MTFVNKTLKDGAGNSFTGRFWDDGSGNLMPVSYPVPEQVTPSLTRVTNSGTVPAGSRSLTIANVGVANGTVLGGTILKPGEVYEPPVTGNNTLAAVPYDATGTEFVIERTV